MLLCCCSWRCVHVLICHAVNIHAVTVSIVNLGSFAIMA
jgi:hypothetical protein